MRATGDNRRHRSNAAARTTRRAALPTDMSDGPATDHACLHATRRATVRTCVTLEQRPARARRPMGGGLWTGRCATRATGDNRPRRSNAAAQTTRGAALRTDLSDTVPATDHACLHATRRATVRTCVT